MPYFTKEYCDQFVGKTIAEIEPFKDNSCHTIVIHFTDGSNLKIVPWVEHEKVTRNVTLVVNHGKDKGKDDGTE
jgi:hypothetical protein